MRDYRKWLSLSNISNFLIIVFLLVLWLVPDTKATIIEGLMKVGLFQPKITQQQGQNDTSGSEVAPSIQFEDKNGKLVNVADLKGKVVFINFWATWCPPCIAEMPSINKLRKNFADNDNIVFLMVDMDSDRAKSTKFMTRKKYDLDVYLPAGPISPEFFSGSLPTTLVFDKSGRLVFKHESGADYTNKKFVEFLEKNTL